MSIGLPLPVLVPNVPETSLWIRHLDTPYLTRQFTNGGSLARRAEASIDRFFLQNTSTIVCASNTSGLIASLLGMGLTNHKVLLSNYTFPATLNAVLAAGAVPVISDVDPDTWEISSSNIENAIERFPDISGVVVTRAHGFRRNYRDIQRTCQDLELKLIIDAAAAFPHVPVDDGIDYSACNVVEVYSFHATKPLGIGEGGAVCGNPIAIKRIRNAVNFGLADDYLTFGAGLNAKMDEFAAARLLSAIERFPDFARKRSEFASELEGILAHSKFLRLPVKVGITSWPFFPVVFDNSERLVKFQKIVASTFQTRRYYFPALSQGFSGIQELLHSGDLFVSEKLSNSSLCLPILPMLDENIKEIYFEELVKGLREVEYS